MIESLKENLKKEFKTNVQKTFYFLGEGAGKKQNTKEKMIIKSDKYNYFIER